MYKASIDIGSNTTLLLIAEYDGAHFLERESKSIVTALGKKLNDNNGFRKESMEATFSALSSYLDLIQTYNIPLEEVVVTATEASRVAQNAAEFYQKVRRELGLGVKIISSDGEAFYTALGVCQNLNSYRDAQDEVVLMDVGGASTELIRVQPRPFDFISSLSLPMGAVRATQWRESGTFSQNISNIFESQENIKAYQTQKLICVAGTMTALGGMIKGLPYFDAKKINGQKMRCSELSSFIQGIENKSDTEILKSYPFLGKRAESIVGGAWVACRLADELGAQVMEISTLGLRYGTLMAQKGVDQRFVTGEY